MRLSEAKVGDRVVLKGTVERWDSDDYSVIRFDGVDDYYSVDHTAEVEIIERPWKVGDRFKWRENVVTVIGIHNDLVWGMWLDDGDPTTFNKEEMKEAVRLLPVEGTPA